MVNIQVSVTDTYVHTYGKNMQVSVTDMYVHTYDKNMQVSVNMFTCVV